MAKVIISSNRPTVTVTLPSYEWSEVIIYTSMTVWAQMELQRKFPWMADKYSPEAFEAGIEMLISSIKERNLYSDAETKLPINKESIGNLDGKDVEAMLAVFNKEKKS